MKVGRVRNFASWSPEFVPDPLFDCPGLAYLCFESEGLWNSSDDGLVDAADVVDGMVVRQERAYPVYDHAYASRVETICDILGRDFPGRHVVGRNGMYRYNNQDHAMMAAMRTVRNILAGRIMYDVWQVSQDAKSRKGGEAGSEAGNACPSGQRLVPGRVGGSPSDVPVGGGRATDHGSMP